LPDESDSFISRIDIHVGYNDFGSFLGKFQRGSTANSGSRPGHKGYLSRYKAHLLFSSQLGRESLM